MLASAHYLSRDYAGAERPLLNLSESKRASAEQRAAAAYGLCGVYEKTKNTVEQLRFALWLRGAVPKGYFGGEIPVYFALSGWDLGLLLDAEAPVETLREFISRYPDARDLRLVKYALAVRRSRENQYEEAAQIYESIHAVVRAPRTRQLAMLYHEAKRSDLPPAQKLDAQYQLADFLASNPARIYFNDTLWYGLQRYALDAAHDSRLTRDERQALVAGERKLKDEQEERWRAYMILRDVIPEAGKTDLGRKAAQLAIRCLRGINSDRFGREKEIREADIELSGWLRQ